MKTKTDIVRSLYESHDKKIPLEELDVIVDSLFTYMTNSLSEGEEIYIDGFGTFSMSDEVKKTLVKLKKR
jgi:nucleoid DNA-binding protein